MTAKITRKIPATNIMPASELTSIYTDRWADTPSELLSSFKKWCNGEIVSFEIVPD